MQKKRRKSVLLPEIQEKIKVEYSLGTSVTILAKRYSRSTSTISRITHGVDKKAQQLAVQVSDVNTELRGYSPLQQTVILKRADEITKIRDTAIRGTIDVQQGILNKLRGTAEEDLTFRDYETVQNVMNKSSVLIETREEDKGEEPITGIRLIG